jgi:Nif-specific regulatory protein
MSREHVRDRLIHVIASLAEAMNRMEEPEEVLEYFLKTCMEATGADSGSIMLYNEEEEILVTEVAIGLDKYAGGMRLRLSEGVTGWVARHVRPRLIDDARTADDYIRVRDDLLSEVAVPLISGGRMIGVLSLDSRKVSAFSQDDVTLLEIVSNLSSTIFVKIADNRTLRMRDRFHRVLLEISRILPRSLSLQEFFEEVMTTTQKAFRIHRSTLFVFDRQAGLLKIVASVGAHTEESLEVTFAPGEGITGTVFQNRQAVFIPSARNEPGFLNRMKVVNEQQDLGFFCCPIFLNHEVVGVFSIFTQKHDVDPKELLEFLQILGSMISQAFAIQNLIEEEKRPYVVENLRLRQELSRKYQFGNLIGRSESMQELFEKIRIIAESRSSVLLTGESGTGKELFASAIHYNSPRRDMPFIKINCAAIPEHLLESELFGHKKGSFTGASADKKGKFEIADGGTIFLDEIGEMDLGLQAKLLRVLQEKEIEPVGGRPRKVDIRVIAATNANLEKLIEEKRFRADLYYRLNVIQIKIPPLRERREDILILAHHFVNQYAKENSKKIEGITPQAIRLLELYDWPGNVRELENMIERAVVLSRSSIIDVDDFSEILAQVQQSRKETMLDTAAAPDERAKAKEGDSTGNTLIERDHDMRSSDSSFAERSSTQKSSLESNLLPAADLDDLEGRAYDFVIGEVERRLIQYAMKRSRYTKTKAAKYLGINRNTLDKRIRELNIDY